MIHWLSINVLLVHAYNVNELSSNGVRSNSRPFLILWFDVWKMPPFTSPFHRGLPVSLFKYFCWRKELSKQFDSAGMSCWKLLFAHFFLKPGGLSFLLCLKNVRKKDSGFRLMKIFEGSSVSKLELNVDEKLYLWWGYNLRSCTF